MEELEEDGRDGVSYMFHCLPTLGRQLHAEDVGGGAILQGLSKTVCPVPILCKKSGSRFSGIPHADTARRYLKHLLGDTPQTPRTHHLLLLIP